MVKLSSRRPGLLGACILVCAVATACASAVDGQGQVGGASGTTTGFPTQPVRSASLSAGTPLPTPSAATSPTPTPTPTSTTPVPPVDLGSLLEPRPSGARGWSTGWGHIRRPSVGQFAKQFYPASSRADVIATLRAQGLSDIAHQTWVAKDSDQIDLVLLRFDSSGGALSRYLAVTSGTASRSDVTRFRVGSHSRGEAQGFRESGHDKYGYVRARTYGRLSGSTVVLEAFFFSPGKFVKPELVRWTDAQLNRLA